MIRDTLHLNLSPGLFLEKTLDDLKFTDGILETFARNLTEKGSNFYHNDEIDYISDTEWQFNQLLTEFAINTVAFSTAINSGETYSGFSIPGIQEKIAVLRANSDIRRRVFDESGVSGETARLEPVVSSAEFNGLLGTAAG